MKHITRYLNPVARLGNTRYSTGFPLAATLTLGLVSEVFAKLIVQDTDVVGVYGVILFVMVVIYFACRDGIKGGLIATFATLAYYVYIILDREATSEEKLRQLEVIAILGVLYVFFAVVIGWLKQTVDVSIEKVADEKTRLQVIIEQLPVGVAITDPKGRIMSGNKQIKVILGRPMRPHLVAGKDTIEDVTYNGQRVPPEDWPLAQALATGEPQEGKNYELERADGSKVYLHINASVIRNNAGRIIAAATILHDITKEREQELRKDDFINIASHELKTPLTSLKLYLETLNRWVDRNPDAKVQKLAQGLQSQTKRLEDLVNNLLDVSRLQTGKMALKLDRIDLNKALHTITQELQQIVSQPIIYTTSEEPIWVSADQFRIDQVITNLISNAVKYSESTQPIRVNLQKDKALALVSVQDYGIGIRKDQQHRIFDRLYQVESQPESTFPGLGMGLYISKEIVKNHQGTIWVDSDKGQGATFYFSLPIVHQQEGV